MKKSDAKFIAEELLRTSLVNNMYFVYDRLDEHNNTVSFPDGTEVRCGDLSKSDKEEIVKAARTLDKRLFKVIGFQYNY